MGLQKNWSNCMRLVKKLRNASAAELSADLQMSRSVVQDYMKGKGNPTLSSVDHIAEKLGIDPVLMISGIENPEKNYVAWLLLETIKEFMKLSEEERVHGAELLHQLLSLFGPKEKGPDGKEG